MAGEALIYYSKYTTLQPANNQGQKFNFLCLPEDERDPAFAAMPLNNMEQDDEELDDGERPFPVI